MESGSEPSRWVRVRYISSESPPGRSSCFLHDNLAAGEAVEVYPPAGDFCCDGNPGRPLVLTPSQATGVRWALLGGLPAVPVFVGLLVLWRRQ